MARDTLLAQFPRERTWLLPLLQAVQRAERYLAPGALDALLAGHPPPYAARATASVTPPSRPTAGSPAARFGALKRDAERRRTGARLAVGMGTCGVAVGARETFEALRVEVQRRSLPFTVVAAGCNGMCWAQPVVEVLRDGRPRLTTGHVSPEHVPNLLNALAANPAGAPDV